MGVRQTDFDALKADHDRLKLRLFAGDELKNTPDNANRLAYADFKIDEGGQSLYVVAASTIALALEAQGKLPSGLTPANVKEIVDAELKRASDFLQGS